jgi:hypothetical protein
VISLWPLALGQREREKDYRPSNTHKRECLMPEQKVGQSTELLPEETCPCGAAEEYGACCKIRGVRWLRDSRGRVHREMPLNADAAQEMIAMIAEFEAVLNRKARKNDRVFIGNYTMSRADQRRATLHMLKAKRAKPEIIYAYLKMDRVIENPSGLTGKQFVEYNAAIQEFQDLLVKGVSVDDLIDPETPEKILREALFQVQIICGYYIETYINAKRPSRRSKTEVEVDLVVDFAFVNYVKSLRSIFILLNEGISYDASFLVRSLYENYLKIKFVYRYPSKVDRFVAELYSLASTKTPQTKRTPPLNWGNMATELGERDLYDTLYRQLCSVTHSQITEAAFFMRDGIFDYLELDFELGVLLSTLDLAMRTIHCVRTNSQSPAYLKRDLATAIEKAFLALHFAKCYLFKFENAQIPIGTSALMSSLSSEYPRIKRIAAIDPFVK